MVFFTKAMNLFFRFQGVSVGFSQRTYIIDEDNTQVNVRVIVSGTLQRSIQLRYVQLMLYIL